MTKTARILLVDDNPGILMVVSGILRPEGHELLTASSGLEALRSVREQRPDLVLLDIGLPDLPGTEVCRQIKSDPGLADVFVLLFSGQATSGPDQLLGADVGADDYIIKPVGSEELRARIRMMMRLRDTTAALRASEQYYRRLIEILPDAVGLIDLEGRVTGGNQQAASMLGYSTPAELLGKTAFDLTSPEDHERVRANMDVALAQGTVRNVIHTFLRKDGTRFPAEVSGAALKDSGGQPFSLVTLSRDISERRRAEEVLSSSEERFRQLAENIKEVFWMTNPEKSEMIYVSPAYAEVWGRNCQSLYASATNWLDAVHAEDRERVLHAALAKQISGQYDEVYRIVRPDGSTRWIHDRAFPIKDAAGKVYRITGIAEDITERKQAEQQIQLLADAVHSAQEFIYVTDTENRFIFVNRAFLAAHGYHEGEVLGKTPHFLFSPKNPPGLGQEILSRTLAGGWRGVLFHQKRDGSEFPVELNTSQITSRDGKLLGLLGVAGDISERQQMERQRTAFAALGYQLSASGSAEQAATTILDVASKLFGWDAGYVHLYEPSQDRIIPVLTMDTLEGRRVSLPSTSFTLDPSPLMRLIMREGAQLINRGGKAQPTEPLVSFGDRRHRSASMMYVPIHAGGLVVGILSIQSYTLNAYAAADLKLLQTLADHCGDALRRIQVSDALREAEAKYRGIVENATEGIFQTTPAGRYLSANRALARMLGYDSPEELISSVTDIEHQTYLNPKKREEFKHLLETQGAVEGFEVERCRKDGTRIWLSVNAHVVRDSNGTLLYYEGTNRDITDRRNTQAALEKSRRLQKALLDNISDPAWLKDTQGRFLACNEAMAKHYGRLPEEMIGMTVFDLAPLDAPRLSREDQEVMHSRKPGLFEGPRTDAAGNVRWFESSKSPIVNERGEVTGTVGVARDVTERKRVAEELRLLPRRIIEAQEAERQRVARELHDSVNQLIASARMRLRKVEDASQEFRPSTREILARCHDLLVQALEENRRIAHDLRPSDLDEFGFTIACRNLCKQFAARTGLAVRCNISKFGERLPPAMELNLFRIVQEAFNNIEKHARAKKVRLSISPFDDAFRLRIQDDGRGFLYRQSRPNSHRKRHGIGLTNIFERATALGGTSEIISQPGQGTTVVIRVPRQKPG